MRVLVTGATGYVGSAIVEALARGGHDVIATRVDIARPETLDPVLPAVDAIVHAALASSAEAPEIDRRFVAHALARLSEGAQRRRFLYTSGIWVLGDTDGALADETSTPRPPALVGWRPEVEGIVTDAHRRGHSAWVVRPGVVWGGSGGLLAMMASSLEGDAVRVVGDGENRVPMIHREDLGRLYVRALEREPDEPILHATDGAEPTQRELALAVAASSGRVVQQVDVGEAEVPLGPLAEALALDQRIASERTRRATGWTPAHRPFLETLTRTREVQR